MAKNFDTGIVMEDEAAPENVVDSTKEVGVAEMTGSVSTPDSLPDEDASAGQTPIAQETAPMDPRTATEIAETDVGAKKEPKTYSQEFVDQLNASHDLEKQFAEQHLREVEEEFKKYKTEHEDTVRRHLHFEDAVKSIYLKLGDATPSKLYTVVSEMAQLKQKVDDANDQIEKLEGTRSQFEAVERMHRELSERYRALVDTHRELDATHKKLQGDYQAEVAAKTECQQQLKSWEAVGSRIIAAFAPLCLKERDWFLEFLTELQEEVYNDPPSDAAILLFASLAELAVMERNSANPCFGWKKQLSDVGLVVANYMHQKRAAEGDVLKMLHDFAQALQEMPILKKKKIVFKLPSLGGDFNTDEVKHKNNGSSISKIHNWCIVEDGLVYCKAIVE